jgi:hypothetical protein|tara:strand:+ start:126 stop:713 length:588 start_codon:yes stop_codon:yes gene_type:complete
MAKMDPELEQRLRDQLRMIEMGETLEDLDDPEDYEDEGGIRSLNRAPSIKMASETGPEEFELELGTVVKEYLDKKNKGETTLTIEEYINDYLSKKRLMKKMMEERAMAMGGGMMRMKYAGGSDDYNPGKMGNPAVMTKIENMREERIMNPDVEDVADYKTYYKMKKKQDDEIKRMLDKAKKEKTKKAKGGIAGVL